MPLTNNFNNWIFWRTFNTGDTAYVFGHRDGWLAPGESIPVTHPHQVFQMEVKSGAPGHPFLSKAGTHYRNDEDIIVAADGRVDTFQNFVEAVSDPTPHKQVMGGILYFFDMRGFSTDTSAKLTTTFRGTSNSSTVRGGQITATTTSENASGGKVEVLAKGDVKGAEAGIKFTGEVSQNIVNETYRQVTGSVGQSEGTEVVESVQLDVPAKARKITAVQIVWTRTFVTGRTTAFGMTHTWERNVHPMPHSQQFTEYDSPGDMPAHVYSAYLDQFPLSGTSIFRTHTPMILDGNTWIGVFVVTDIQPGGSFSGTCYGDPMTGRYDEGFGDLQFVRTLNPAYLQRWYANTTNPKQINGSFHEEINLQTTGQTFGWSMAATLLVTTDRGESFRFKITQMEQHTGFSGMLGDVALTGSWDQATQTITFNRPTGNGQFQTWSGHRIAGLTFQGGYMDGAATVNWTMRPD
jgi:hypothetical protein